MDRSILRGGRFTRENDMDDSSVLALTIRTILQYVVECCSWRKKVLFEKHSDGSILSKRYVYDRQKAPQDAVLDIQMQTPSPVIPDKRRSRIATPMVKRVPFPSNDKENEKPVSAGVGAKANAKPMEGERRTSRNQVETSLTETQQPIDFRLPPSDRSTKPKHNLTMPAYRPQPVPIGPPLQTQTKQPSFLDKPLDPHFFHTYAPKGSFIRQVSPSLTKNVSSNSKKRKLEVDSPDGPRKRPSLKRSHDNRAFRHTPANPKKRKERVEELLLEFSRKRPKKDAEKVDSSVKVVDNPFGRSTEDTKSDGKPSFQFGTPSASIASSDDTKSDGKPVFQFGAATDVTAASNDAKSDGKPAFQFGAAAASTAPSDDSKSDGKPAFQFGAASTMASTSDDPKSDGKPTFQFGAAAGTATSSSGTTSHTAQPAFQFGAESASSPADAAALGSASSLTTAQGAVVQKPSFTFGAPPTSTPGPSATLMAGATVTVADASAPTPATSFGALAPAESAGAPQPAFTFGGAAPAASSGSSSNPFAFGGTGAPTVFGGPGAAMLPGPVNRGGAMRRRAGRTVGGRSVRRGAA